MIVSPQGKTWLKKLDTHDITWEIFLSILTWGCVVQEFNNVWVWNNFENSNFFHQSGVLAVEQFKGDLLCCKQGWNTEEHGKFYQAWLH